MHPSSAPPLYRRADWLGARATLAGRLNARLAVTTAAAFLCVLGTLAFADGTWRSGVELSGQSDAAAALAALRSLSASWMSMLAASSILGLLLGYTLNLAREIARPRLAGALEVERASGLPVIARIAAESTSGVPERIDPCRLAYLSVSPAGNRAHTIVLTGEDPASVAAIGARIARAAADDARATLVVDLDAERAPVAACYGVRSDPGFTEAIVGVRLWREVSLPIGASSGLSIDVVPGGSVRRDSTAPRSTPEFEEFLREHDFCVIVASGPRALRRATVLVPGHPTILCVEREVTTLSLLSAWRTLFVTEHVDVHGVVVASAPTIGD